MPYQVLDAVYLQASQSGHPLIYNSLPLTGGVNMRLDPRWIDETEAAELVNVDLDDPASPSTRAGTKRVLIGSDGMTTSAGNRFAAIGEYLPPNSSPAWIAAVTRGADTGLWATWNPEGAAQEWKELQDGASQSVDVGSDDAFMLQANGNFWIFSPGSSSAWMVDEAFLVSTSTGLAPANPVDATYLFERLWVLQGTKLYYTTLLPTAFSAFDQSAQSLDVSPRRQAEAVAVVSWRSGPNASLIVFFEDSIEEVIVDNSTVANSTRNTLSETVGCSSRDSVVLVGEDIVFADQYGQIRSLRRTITGEMQGVAVEPLSARVSPELPGRAKKGCLGKIRCALHRELLLVAFARDVDDDPLDVMVYHTSRGVWWGRWRFPRPIGNWLGSRIRGEGEDLFFTDGQTLGTGAAGPQVVIYRMFTKETVDQDVSSTASYEWTIRPRALDFGVGEADKVFETVEFELDAAETTVVTTSAKTRLGADWTSLPNHTITESGSFPLKAADFPLVDASFPLTEDNTNFVKLALTGLPGDARGRILLLKLTVSTTSDPMSLRRWSAVARPVTYKRE